jgi:hypothetical protein
MLYTEGYCALMWAQAAAAAAGTHVLGAARPGLPTSSAAATMWVTPRATTASPQGLVTHQVYAQAAHATPGMLG